MTRKPLCIYKHRMVMVVPDLYLCECSSYGKLTNLKGAVEDARELVARQGGIAKLRMNLEIAEALEADARIKERKERVRLIPRRDIA